MYYTDDEIKYEPAYKKSCKRQSCNGCQKCIIVKSKHDLYNGMIGQITNVDANFYEIAFSNHSIGTITIHMSIFHAKQYMSLSYINTVYKYQGSENKIAILIFTEGDKNFLNKNMIYTALSRASKKCLIISHIDSYKNGLDKKCNRQSQLFNMLTECMI